MVDKVLPCVRPTRKHYSNPSPLPRHCKSLVGELPYTPKVLKDMLDLTHKKEEDRLAVCSDEGGGSGLSKYL